MRGRNSIYQWFIGPILGVVWGHVIIRLAEIRLSIARNHAVEYLGSRACFSRQCEVLQV